MKLGLVLSGGGARCFAQIGVLQALEEANIRPSALAGCSTGAVLAALYAAGYSARQLLDLADNLDYQKLISKGATGALSDETALRDWLGEHLPASFEDLNCPLVIVAVDIQVGELHMFSQGDLISVVCGSHAFPGLFTPVSYKGFELMDGGILNNLPTDSIRPLTKDKILAISCSTSPEARVDLESQGPLGFVRSLLSPFTGAKASLPPMVELLEKAYTITQSKLIDINLERYPPDYLLVPPLPSNLSIYDFERLGEAYEIGYSCAQSWLKTLNAQDA